MYRWLNMLAVDLRAKGVKVVEEPGWKTRGHDPARYDFEPRFVMWHHDASPKGASPGVVAYMRDGAKGGLTPPYGHAWVALDGTWHLIAAGHAFHAGKGGPYDDVPADDMNRYAFGIEADHTVGERWSPVQLDALRTGTAAVLRRLDAKPDPGLLFHKTWAPDRKVDPDGLDLDTERAAVGKHLGVRPPVVRVADVQYGKRNPSVLLVQRALAATVGLDYSTGPGVFGPRTREAYARWQRTRWTLSVEKPGVPGALSLGKLGRLTHLFWVPATEQNSR